MLRGTIRAISFGVILTFMFASLWQVRAQVRVVNMIPNDMSDETRHNSEPYLAVNPANPLILAASVFMATPAGSPNGPLLVSFDGGSTWFWRNIIPSSPGAFFNTGDITLRFNTTGTALYAGILRVGPPGGLQIITTTDMTLNTPMIPINTPRPTDQPYINARTVVGGVDSGKDRLWVANNDAAANPASATVDQSLDAAIATPTFSQIRIDADTPVGRDNYQVRTVSSADGHVYAAFYRRKGSIAGGYNADVVVVRDDNWGQTMPPLRNLVDTVTTVPGQNVVASTPVSDTFGSSPALGNDWWGGDLYLTVDPSASSRVYISYSDSLAGSPRTIHLRRSTTSGQTWDPDLLTIPSAKNAAIAINSQGKIAYLYQQLTGASPNTHWQTHLRRSSTGAVWDDVTLADFPAEGPGAPTGSRIIGDYLNMVAVGKDFYGVFTSDNDLVNASFPAGVTWLRNKTPNGAASPHFLGTDGVTTVAPSIDPFFFHVDERTPTSLVYQGDTSADYHDPANLAATLKDQTNGQPISNATVQFTLGSQGCTALTNAAGLASCTLVLDQCAGSYTVTASFAGSALYLPSSDSKPFTVNLEETTLTYTGDTVIANGGTATLSGVLMEDSSTPIVGRTVTFTLGAGGSAQTCSGVTNASGVAACSISPVAQPLGPGTVSASFVGDACYRPASTNVSTVLFEFPASGAFVVGDLSAQMGAKVTFWGAKWSNVNKLSGGAAPPSFKGFAATLGAEPPRCGITWTTGPGNSSNPPATVPAYMGVLVSSKVSKSGSTISGDAKSIVVVKTDPGYAPNPGHAGTGTVVAAVCHP